MKAWLQGWKKDWKKRLFTWESMLVVLLILLWILFDWKDSVNVARGVYKKEAFGFVQVIGGMQPYMLYSFMTLGMMMVLAMGDIDISVGAIGALSASVMFVVYKGISEFGSDKSAALLAAVVLCLLTGTLCGAFNGLLITRFKELFPMIITLATMLFFRGLCYLLLGGNTLTFKDDAVFERINTLNNTVTIGALNIPVILFWFLAAAAIFYVILHRTAAGRRLFAVGTNPIASRYSGLRVDRIKLLVFSLTGTLSAISSIFYVGAASRSIRADAMEGYEMYAIAAAVLGGFSTSGGKGNVGGVALSLLIFGVVKKGLGTVFSLPDSTVNLAVGAILILSVLLPNVVQDIRTAARLRRQHEQALSENS